MGYKRPKPKGPRPKAKLKPLTQKDLKPIFKNIEERWGVNLKSNDYVFFISAKDNIYRAKRAIDDMDLTQLHINTIGLYILEWKKTQARLSIEGSQIIGPKATKNVIELNKGLFTLWIAGNDLELKHDDPGYVILKYKNDYVGCGHANGERIYNYVPKIRRVILD